MDKNIGLTPAQIHKAITGLPQKNNQKPTPLVKKSNKPEKVFKRQEYQDVELLFDLPYSTNQLATQLPTPTWFTYQTKADISIIVPLYRNEISNLVDTWDFNTNGLKTEFIFVDDNCPINSGRNVVNTWKNKYPDTPHHIGRIYVSAARQGWGSCCNIGAEVATGEIIIFLHPNMKIVPNWLSTLVRLIRKSDVGAVGGLHIDEINKTIIEAGKEWSWEQHQFVNIGQTIFNSRPITKPFNINNCPAPLFNASECDAVSSLCMAVRREVFLYMGGFCPNLFNQEWSDADFCLSLKQEHFKIMCQPNARVYHEEINLNKKYALHGKTYFDNKWDISGRIDNLIKSKRITPKTEVRNIILRRQSAHGDVLIAAAVAPALKKKYPKAKILFETECPEVIQGNPWIDKILENERTFNLFYNLDMVYEYRPKTNILQAFADMVGVPKADCQLFLQTENITFDLPEKYIAIHAGRTLWAGRNWSTLKFDQLSKRLKEANYNIVSIGTLSDHKPLLCDIDLRGKTTIPQLATIIKNTHLFVGIDSFPMHIAQVFSVPGIAFFGSIEPTTRIIDSNMTPLVAPNIKCLGCHHRKSTPCTDTSTCEIGIQECINNVSVDMMFQAIEKKLSTHT